MGTVKDVAVKRRGRGISKWVAKVNWVAWVFVVLLFASLLLFFEPHAVLPVSTSPASKKKSTKCLVHPTFLGLHEIDSPIRNGTIPDHVFKFDDMNIKLPKYPASKLLLVSATSNNTYEREIAQRYTFGRIYDIRFVPWDEYPHCVICPKKDHDNRCHCPTFKKPCRKKIFFYREVGWWCHSRKELFSIMTALKEWKGKELPKWLLFMDDNTFINPISMNLLIENLDPDKPYFLGDTMSGGGIAAGGAGALLSRDVLRKLMGPPVQSTVTYHWPNGTHSVKVHSQLEYCLAQMQGGNWCYFHADWGLSQCVRDIGVKPIDLGAENHGAFFTQRYKVRVGRGPSWFYLNGKQIADVFHRTHAAAVHSPTVDDMYSHFYAVVVPYYQNLRFAYRPSVGSTR